MLHKFILYIFHYSVMEKVRLIVNILLRYWFIAPMDRSIWTALVRKQVIVDSWMAVTMTVCCWMVRIWVLAIMTVMVARTVIDSLLGAKLCRRSWATELRRTSSSLQSIIELAISNIAMSGRVTTTGTTTRSAWWSIAMIWGTTTSWIFRPIIWALFEWGFESTSQIFFLETAGIARLEIPEKVSIGCLSLWTRSLSGLFGLRGFRRGARIAISININTGDGLLHQPSARFDWFLFLLFVLHFRLAPIFFVFREDFV